jgi:hypothetical protein
MPSIRLFLSTRLSSALSLLRKARSLGHAHIAVIVLGDCIKKLSFLCPFEQSITCATRYLICASGLVLRVLQDMSTRRSNL